MDRRRLIAFLILLFTGALLVWFSMKTKNEDSKVNIGRSDIRIEDGVLTPEVLWSMQNALYQSQDLWRILNEL